MDRFSNDGHHGGSSGGGGNGEIEIQQFPDTVFVQGLPDDITEEVLAQQFGAIGPLKVMPVCNLWQDQVMLS